MSEAPSTVVVFTRDGLGHTESAELRHRLAETYLKLTLESGRLPEVMAFYTEGVRLVCEGSRVLEPLRALEERGVRLVICSTCLNYFGLGDQVRVGVVGGMGDILTAMQHADKVISL